MRNLQSCKDVINEVFTWMMLGTGGGGYLGLVVKDLKQFANEHPGTIEFHIRK